MNAHITASDRKPLVETPGFIAQQRETNLALARSSPVIGSGSDAGSAGRERRLRSRIVSDELMRALVTRASTQESSSMSGISRPAVSGGFLLYLDYDGVLHPEDVRMDRKRRPYVASPPGHELFEHATLLYEVLAPHPDIRIVLSTSWVHVFGNTSKVAKRLPPALGARVIGATYHSEMDRQQFAQKPRGKQIWQDVYRRQPTAWVALDDDDADWPSECRDRLVRTHPVLGLSAPEVLAALQAKLAGMYAVDRK